LKLKANSLLLTYRNKLLTVMLMNWNCQSYWSYQSQS